MPNEDNRPDPDELLEMVQREEAQAARGKLKVFFGACPAVGKTYAMLSAARLQDEQGLDLVVGGRKPAVVRKRAGGSPGWRSCRRGLSITAARRWRSSISTPPLRASPP